MHREVGDRTCVPEGAFTVAGLCRDLTGFATSRPETRCLAETYHETTARTWAADAVQADASQNHG
jgi:hypothetical protein